MCRQYRGLALRSGASARTLRHCRRARELEPRGSGDLDRLRRVVTDLVRRSCKQAYEPIHDQRSTDPEREPDAQRRGVAGQPGLASIEDHSGALARDDHHADGHPSERRRDHDVRHDQRDVAGAPMPAWLMDAMARNVNTSRFGPPKPSSPAIGNAETGRTLPRPARIALARLLPWSPVAERNAALGAGARPAVRGRGEASRPLGSFRASRTARPRPCRATGRDHTRCTYRGEARLRTLCRSREGARSG